MLNQMFQGIGAASRGGQDSPLMDTLAAMSLQDLQKYAQAHKNDAATVALISSIANIKKKAIASEQAQPVDAQQPKIGEQVIAGIAPQPAPQAIPQRALPEDQGIAQLPADNLKGMAGGGIVAFEAGGEVPRFQNQGLVGSTPRLSGESFQDYRRRVFEEELQTQRDRNNAAVTTRETERQRLLAQQPDGLIPPSPFFDRKPLPASPAMQAAGIATDSAPTNKKQITTDKAPIDVSKVEKVDGKKQIDTLVDKPTAPKVLAPTPAPTPGLPGLTDAYKVSTAAELGASAKQLAGDANKESEAAYKPYAEMLQKERADLDARKGDNKNMALLQAGLAIMGGTSSNPFENIGKGATQGLAAYQEAKRLDDASKKALMGSEIAMMQAQRAERSGNHKDAVALLGQSEQSKQFGVNAAMKAQELKQTEEYQKGIVAVQRGRNEILGASNRQSEKQMAEYTKIQNAVTKSLENDTNYIALKTPAEKNKYATEALRNAMARNPFLAALSANIGFVQAPTAGQMRGDYTADQ